MPRGRITFLIVVAAAVAIIAVVVSSGGIDWPFGGDDETSEQAAETPQGAMPSDDPDAEQPDGEAEQQVAEKPEREEMPENPDDVHGDDVISLTRPANLRRAMAVLDARRRKVEGVFESIRIAPGRIDTIIVHPDDRRTNIQVRNDFEVAFDSTHDFPTSADFRDRGMTGRDVRVNAPANLLRRIDPVRKGGNAAHDVDYLVVSKGIVDGEIGLGAYMRIRTARPRMFIAQPGGGIRAIG